MKNTITALCVFIISSVNIISQEYDNGFINPLLDFYSFNYLNTSSAGRGFAGIASENDISGFNLNPASVNLSTNNQINIQYTYKTSQPWLKGSMFGDDMYLRQQLFSGSIGYGKKINKNLLVGIIYNNPSSLYFDMGKSIKTDPFGNETGSYDAYYSVTTHAINIPFVYSKQDLKIGINLNYMLSRFSMPGEMVSSINQPEGYDYGTFSGTSHFFKVHAGLIYKINKRISIGVKVVSGGKSNVNTTYPNGIAGDQPSNANYPWKAGAGLLFAVNKNITVLADYNFTGTSMQNGLKDRHDGHIGIEGNLNKSWALRGGFFTLRDYRQETQNIHYTEPVGDYDQYFITIGAGYTGKNISADIALLTSEISPGKIKNTYINGGLTFNF